MSRNPITLEALEMLDAIERRGSFAKAAEELGKATSALSYLVQKLEEQLAITLFQRQGRRSVLTPAGRILLEDGRHIVNATRLLADKAREVATGWEPSLRIAIESIVDQPTVFQQLQQFLQEHPSMELDISECVLGGGWDALEHDRVDIVIGAPGPAPQQKGIRAVRLGETNMVPVIGAAHPLAKLAKKRKQLELALPNIRRVITHDTTATASNTNIARTAGLVDGQMKFYVENSEQKLSAIIAGIGIGHLPIKRIAPLVKNGSLITLDLGDSAVGEHFIAWKIAHKGNGLKALSKRLSEANWE